MPRGIYSLPGQAKCTEAPYPSGNGTVPRRNTVRWLISYGFSSGKTKCVSSLLLSALSPWTPRVRTFVASSSA